MKSISVRIWIVAVLVAAIIGFSPITSEVNAVSAPASAPKITHVGQVVDSITYRGTTTNAVYTIPYSSSLAKDWTYGCFVIVKAFYQNVYGINVSNLQSTTSIPQASSGQFTETRTPRKGDIVRFNNTVHWALVKSVNGTTVTLIQQNAWWNNYTCAQVGVTADFSDPDVSYFTYSGYLPDICKVHTWDAGTVTKDGDCQHPGEKTYTCTVCGEKKIEEYKPHKYEIHKLKQATLKKDGSLTWKCSLCGKKKSESIHRVKTVKLEGKSFTYTGSPIHPAVTVKDSKGKAIDPKYYSLEYKFDTDVGAAGVYVTFSDRYSGMVKKAYQINPIGTTITSLKAGEHSFEVSWNKQELETDGYVIQYATNEKFTKNKKTIRIKDIDTVAKTVSGLSGNKTYYVRLRTYATFVSLPYFYSDWSATQSIKTKGTSYDTVVYDDVIVSGNYAYCNFEGGITRVDLNTNTTETLTDGWGIYDRIHSMKLKDNYLYFITGNTDAWFHLYRVKLSNNKLSRLAKWTDTYMIKGNIIYYTYIREAMDTGKTYNRKMKLDGSSKKKTNTVAVMDSKESNESGYSVTRKDYYVGEQYSWDDDNYTESWLITPDGKTINIGKAYWGY